LAYKNLWFKRRVGYLGILAVCLFFLSVAGLLTLYEARGYAGLILGAAVEMFLVFFAFPLAVLYGECKRDPEYIDRLASTLPQYYD
jgi:hypothetical protein